MSALTMGLADAKSNFSRVTVEVNRTSRPVTILKNNNKPWVVIQPVKSADSSWTSRPASWTSTRTPSKSSPGERAQDVRTRVQAQPWRASGDDSRRD